MKIIAHIHTDFPTKFGVPRQSGLVDELVGEIVFEPEYRCPRAFFGIEEFSHLWLIWEFSAAKREGWSQTVFPPRLGGRKKRGVFATRSPYRPNPIGLSCVKLERVISDGPDAPRLIVSGIDLMDGTPIYDIKPYLPYADSRPDAVGGFGEAHKDDRLEVVFPDELLCRFPESKRAAARRVLEQDPRAAYNKQLDYVYGLEFAGFDIQFKVENDTLTVVDVINMNGKKYKDG